MTKRAAAAHPGPPPVHTRHLALDALRGVAMVWMTIFHFCFDLTTFGWLQANFYQDPFWTLQRSAIVTMFVLCAGLGQSAARHEGQSTARFWRRWAQVVAGAVLVSLGSWVMFPNSYIYFGVLHGMALMLLIARFARLRPGAWWMLAAVALLAPWSAQVWTLLQPANTWPQILDSKAWNWLGLVSKKPITEDYVPLLPWLGVMALAMAVGPWLLKGPKALAPALSTRLQTGWAQTPARALAWLGRHSLSYYLLHQPVLIGLLWLATGGPRAGA